MRTLLFFKNGHNRAICLPRDVDFNGVNKREIIREGDSIILLPVRPTWSSFTQLEKADANFMAERECMEFLPSAYCKAAWIAITWLNRYPNLSERGDDKRVYAKDLKKTGFAIRKAFAKSLVSEPTAWC